ncbi:uncharacterized protein EHS24_000418 [Apiotrichum porosum]|uniref:GCF C-terminal domain-containing protein n=1 Tax=Apiotrichum porosum TaxID=105984 RepID=A0A427Y9R4_9TREE|nr:uncharacterized protein EHS24_000418 [Apiotrichum porosum]RSH87900.1 hypothetical protein EHS24_000418 [Apiotrichum porosum]
MFVKRARPRPQVRAREADEDEVATAPSPASSGDTGDEVGSVMERKKAQRKKQLGKSKLSFGGDDEAGGSDSTPFKQRKSLLSQALKASAPSTPAAAASTSGAGAGAGSSSSMYSRDYLDELKAATPSRAPRPEDGDGDGGLSRAAQDKYASAIEDDRSAGIPDAAAIAAAKHKRSAALGGVRGAKGEDMDDEYISLGGDNEPHPESRLMREEDEGEDGDEDLADYTESNQRLYIGKDANRAAARRLRGEIGEMIAEREAESDSDEETRAWEDTIVARAGTGMAEAKKEPKKAAGYVPTKMPSIRPVPTIASVEARIAQSIAELRAVKIENESNLETANRDLVLLEEQERDIRKQVESVEGKREWVEEFQGWAEMLGTFLEEKHPLLEGIEKDATKFQRERASMISERRAADDSDDLSLFLGIPTNVPEGSKVDTSTANSDFRRVRRTARDDRRGRRRGIVVASETDEGFSTDSELDPDTQDEYDASQHDLERRVHALLEDVKAEDFRYPEKGLAVRFDDWRSRYPDDYDGAFGGLALVQAWEFWARGEMVGWDPLRSDSQIESFTWFTALYNYSRPRNGHDEDDMDIDEVGPEGDLATEMVSKAVVPVLIRALEAGAYDPYSAPQTRRAVDIAEVIAELTGKDSKKYSSLLKAIMGVYQVHIFSLAAAVASSGGPGSTRPPPYNPTSRSAMQRYVRRRLKLLRNLLLWRRVAPNDVPDLVARIVSVVLRPVLSRTWEGGGEDMAKKVLEVAGAHLPHNLVTFLQKGP